MKRYVLIDEKTGALFQDDTFAPEEAACLNMKLAAAGDPCRWYPYAERQGDAAA